MRAVPHHARLSPAEIAVARQRAEWAAQRIAIAKRRELLFEILLGPAQRAEMIMPVEAWENDGGAVPAPPPAPKAASPAAKRGKGKKAQWQKPT